MINSVPSEDVIITLEKQVIVSQLPSQNRALDK